MHVVAAWVCTWLQPPMHAAALCRTHSAAARTPTIAGQLRVAQGDTVLAHIEQGSGLGSVLRAPSWDLPPSPLGATRRRGLPLWPPGRQGFGRGLLCARLPWPRLLWPRLLLAATYQASARVRCSRARSGAPRPSRAAARSASWSPSPRPCSYGSSLRMWEVATLVAPQRTTPASLGGERRLWSALHTRGPGGGGHSARPQRLPHRRQAAPKPPIASCADLSTSRWSARAQSAT